MTEIESSYEAQDPLRRMQQLLRSIHLNDYADLEQMGEFLGLVNGYSAHSNGGTDYYEKLDSPDLDLLYGDDVFDTVVSRFDALGGSSGESTFMQRQKLAGSWQEDLQDLHVEVTMNDPYLHRSVALYARIFGNDLKTASHDDYYALLRHPSILAVLPYMNDYQEMWAQDDELARKDKPSYWPAEDDGFLHDVLRAVGYAGVRDYEQIWSYVRPARTSEAGYKFPAVECNTITENLRAIAELEAERPGAVQFLSREFGIRHFCRYPLDLLTHQFDTKGKVDRPYGVAISAVNDHNGAFTSAFMPVNLYPSATNVGVLHTLSSASHDMLVAEVQTGQEFVRRLKQFDKLNGELYKLDFAFIEAHGRPESIAFGNSDEVGRIALGTKMSNTRQLFSKRACIALSSCSAGQVNGIAQSLSQRFNTIVVAAPEVVSTVHLNFKADEASVRIIPDFVGNNTKTKVMPVVFKKGSPLGIQKTTEYLS